MTDETTDGCEPIRAADAADAAEAAGATQRLRVLERRPPVTAGWRDGDVVRRTFVRRRRRRVAFGGTATAVVAAVTLALTLSGGDGTTRREAYVPGVHVGARIDGAVQLVSDHQAPAPPSGPVAQVVRAQQLLAIKLLQNLDGDGDNVSVSPESLQLALGMLQNGARGTTRTQIAKALQTPGISTQQQNLELASLTGAEAAAARGNLQLDTANSLWQQQGLRLRPQFLAALASYGAGVWQTDFQTSQGLNAINRWTDRHTHGKIPKLFDTLDPMTVLVLADALYFRADWRYAFAKGATETGRFTTADGRHVSAHFMNGDSGLGSVTTRHYAAAQLPYRGGRFAALAVMPLHQSLTSFVDGLTPARVASMAASARPSSRAVDLPRFTTSSTTNLVPTLERLGMRRAFTSTANLSGISSAAAYVSQVAQRVYLRVNERGTTAAAATGVAITATSSLGSEPIRFDHPFLFLVRDKRTGAILFATEVNDPTAG